MFWLFEKINNNTVVKVVIVTTFLLVGIFFAKFYQSADKTSKLYVQALKDFNNENYQNSYYLFSKIGFISVLKPVALYRQSLCAKALGDEKSELESLEKIIKYYPKDKIVPEAKYLIAQIVHESDSNLAKKYFNDVLKSNIDKNYKLAAYYYLAKIQANKLDDISDNPEINSGYRKYLTEAPDGRLAVEVSKNWMKYNKKLTSKDYTLIARAYNCAELFNEADEILSKTDIKDSWAVQVATLYGKRDYSSIKDVLIKGISDYSSGIMSKDYKNAVDMYLKVEGNTLDNISYLFDLAKGNSKDYIWMLKCENSPVKTKYSCYEDFYKNYPGSEYSSLALENIFMGKIVEKDYQRAREIGNNYYSKFPNSENIDMIMFWRAKIEHLYAHNPRYTSYYQDIINNYPDSYYAYRAFWILNRFNHSVININIDYKTVEYPYDYPSKNSTIGALIMADDYDMIKKYTNDDFIKSWTEYKKGNYSTSMHMAQIAMKNLKSKPSKHDLRWRLVYPLNYYKQIENVAYKYGNSPALMTAIAKEESYFNPYAQSGSGAMGLMQLMPSTAHEIGEKNNIDFSNTALFNPELNILLGNLYYSTLRNMLSNQDISAVASYNGGIGSVKRWKTNLAYSDTDDFVEKIPYDETRNYVKKVFRSYWNYIRIYQK